MYFKTQQKRLLKLPDTWDYLYHSFSLLSWIMEKWSYIDNQMHSLIIILTKYLQHYVCVYKFISTHHWTVSYMLMDEGSTTTPDLQELKCIYFKWRSFYARQTTIRELSHFRITLPYTLPMQKPDTNSEGTAKEEEWKSNITSQGRPQTKLPLPPAELRTQHCATYEFHLT